MTITATTNVAIAVGNGSTTVFPFTFRVDDVGELSLILLTIADSTEEEIGSSNYTVAGIGDAAGGSVTYNPSGVPVPSTKKVILKRIVPYTQPISLNNQGGFFPEVVATQLDRMVMQMQQLAEVGDRTVTVPTGVTVTDFSAFQINMNLLVTADITTLTAISGDITTVAGLSTEILAIPGQVTAAGASETNALNYLNALKASTAVATTGAIGASYDALTNQFAFTIPTGATGNDGADGADGSDGADGADGADGTSGIEYTTVTSATTAVSGAGYVADTSGGAWSLTLPASPANNDVIEVLETGGWATNSLTILRNGKEIQGVAEDLVCNANDALVKLVFNSADDNWKVTVSMMGSTSSILNGVAIGSLHWFPKDGAVAGYLKCDGTTFDAAVYPDLNTFLGGNTLPNLTNRVLRMAGADTGAAGSTQEDAMQGHSHTWIHQDGGSNGNGTTGTSTSSSSIDNGTIGPMSIITDGVNGAPRTASETRVKSFIGVAYIKAYSATTEQGLLDLVAMEASINNALSKSAQTLTDTQKAQVLANLGLVNNRVVNKVRDVTLYGASTDRHIVELDTSITTTSDSSKVEIQAVISFERNQDGAFYLKRDGVEVGSADAAGSRHHGLAVISYETDNNSTMQVGSILFEDEPASSGSHTYSVWIRGSNHTLSLNRTLTDTNNTSCERVTSIVKLTEYL